MRDLPTAAYPDAEPGSGVTLKCTRQSETVRLLISPFLISILDGETEILTFRVRRSSLFMRFDTFLTLCSINLFFFLCFLFVSSFILIRDKKKATWRSSFLQLSIF